VTYNWIKKQFDIGSVEPIHDLKTKNISQPLWSDDLYLQLENLLVDTRSGERLYLVLIDEQVLQFMNMMMNIYSMNVGLKLKQTQHINVLPIHK